MPREKGKTDVGKSVEQANAPEPTFTVVGVGASAGGLEAMRHFLLALGSHPGAAIIYLQHLDPNFESVLPTLFAAATQLPIHVAADGMALEVDHLYVIPPHTDVRIQRRILRLTARGMSFKKPQAVDYMLGSLAEALGPAAIGVILSGTGSDGTFGIKQIKRAGGPTFAQAPESAKFDGMPAAAIGSGDIDYVLTPQDIAHEIVRLIERPFTPPVEEPGARRREGDPLLRILNLIGSVSGVDFHGYKRAMIRRRFQRRMAASGIATLEAFADFLENDPNEVRDLHKDLLITVSSFFREPEAYRYLKTKILPTLMQDRPPGTPIRIWVPGCAAGEEPYSLAIAVLEFLGDSADSYPVQIFGTDLSEAVIRRARAGTYSVKELAGVSQERLRRFFGKVDGTYQISKRVRDLCVFARHNLTRDPPFSKMDLVSCQNVMIYLETFLQRKVIQTFHYSLKPGGFLILGSAETIGSSSDLFSISSSKLKVYIRKAFAARSHFEIERGTVPFDREDQKTKPPAFMAPPRETRRKGVPEQVPAAKPAAETPAKAPVRRGKGVEPDMVSKLERELQAAKEHLSEVLDEHDATNEELKSAIEEATSAYEELQSINEELETAKEELQSTNEELNSVNEELQVRNTELSRVNSDMNNLLSSIDIPILMLDPDTRIRRYTPRIVPLFNLIPGDIGRPIGHLQLAIDLPDFEATIREVIRTGKPIQREALGHDRNWYSVWFRPYLTREGTADGAVVAFLSITERLRAEEERRRFETQIQETQRLESLGVLAGGVAHDFNNLLVAILGSTASAMRQLPDKSPAAKTLEQIENAAMRAADLTRQMLAYSGKGRFVIDRLDLSELVLETAKLLEAAIARQATIKFDLSRGLPAIEADPTGLRQVVMNLILNAGETVVGPKGTVNVRTGTIYATRKFLAECQLGDTIQPGEFVFVEIEDSGQGIDAETKKRMFDPFFTTKFTGRGLGLAVVLGIVRGHKGAVHVATKLGKGTAVRVLFPAFDSAANGPPVEKKKRKPVLRKLPGGVTLLVVDDEALVRASVRQILEDSGIAVIEAASSSEALDKLIEPGCAITAIILDATMPGLSGLETILELRRRGITLPVLLVSGYSEEDFAATDTGESPTAFLAKPFRPADLIDKVREILTLT